MLAYFGSPFASEEEKRDGVRFGYRTNRITDHFVHNNIAATGSSRCFRRRNVRISSSSSVGSPWFISILVAVMTNFLGKSASGER